MRVAEGKVRPKQVVVRLSEEEYDLLTKACYEMGGRSISDSVRQAILNYGVTTRSGKGLLSNDLATITARLEQLAGMLQQLQILIGRCLGQPGGREGGTRGSDQENV